MDGTHYGADFMPKYKVTSGEFEIVVSEKTPRKAGDEAIRLHDESNHPSKLGDLTLIEKLDRNSQPTGEHAFISTQHLIADNTAGLGDNPNQYQREEDEKDQ